MPTHALVLIARAAWDGTRSLRTLARFVSRNADARRPTAPAQELDEDLLCSGPMRGLPPYAVRDLLRRIRVHMQALDHTGVDLEDAFDLSPEALEALRDLLDRKLEAEAAPGRRVAPALPGPPRGGPRSPRGPSGPP